MKLSSHSMEKQYLIVGQGLAGSLLGYEMYKAGVNFTIISNPNVSRATDVAAGMYNPLVFKRLTKSWMVDELLPVMTNKYETLEKLLGLRLLYPMDIIKPLVDNESKLWHDRIFEGKFSDYIVGIENDFIGKGITRFGSLGRVTNSGYVHLGNLIMGLRDFFQSKGVLIESEFKYKDLGFINGDVTWHGIKTRTIVFCEGYHAYRNPYFKSIGFKPTKGELLEIECEGLSEEYILNKNLFIMPVGDHRFKVGATYDWENLNEELTQEARADLLDRLDKIISLPYKVLNHWAGVRPTIKDRRPVLGKHPAHKQIAIFNGLGTKGVMLAPYFAQEMIRSLLFDSYPLAKEVNINRFF